MSEIVNKDEAETEAEAERIVNKIINIMKEIEDLKPIIAVGILEKIKYEVLEL